MHTIKMTRPTKRIMEEFLGFCYDIYTCNIISDGHSLLYFAQANFGLPKFAAGAFNYGKIEFLTI